MKRVLVFGVFDGLHKGHDAMLYEARALGDELYVAVAQDSVVRKLKNKPPKRLLEERVSDVGGHGAVTRAVPGDLEIGSFKILEVVKPDIVACGYDQIELKKVLEQYVLKRGLDMRIATLSPFEPQKYHSSILNV